MKTKSINMRHRFKWVRNKIDLLEADPDERREIRKCFCVGVNRCWAFGSLGSTVAALATDVSGAIPNRRHTENLKAPLARLGLALEGFESRHPSDLVVTHLRVALFELDRLPVRQLRRICWIESLPIFVLVSR